MTARRAIVLLDDGKEGELPLGDTLEGAGSSSGLTLVQLAQEILEVTPSHWIPSQLKYDSGANKLIKSFSPIPVTAALTTAYRGVIPETGWIVPDTGNAGSGITRPVANQSMIALNTGTTATGTVYLNSASVAGSAAPSIGDFTPTPILQGDIAGWVSRISFSLPILSTAAQEYNVRLCGGLGTLGVSDAEVAEVTLRYTRTASTNWRIFYRTDASWSVYVDTGVAVTTAQLEFITYVVRTGVGAYTIHWGLRNAGNSTYLATGTITNSFLNTAYWVEGTISIANLLGGTIAILSSTAGTTSRAVRITGFQQRILLSPP